MNIRQTASASPTGSRMFDQLRSRVESEVPRPAVLSITSSTSQDGKDLTARGLAYSLASTGYTTLFVDTSPASRGYSKPLQGLSIEEIGRLQFPTDSGAGNLSVLSLSDPNLHATTSQRSMKAALDNLRTKFDYIVISTEYDASNSFANSVFAGADVVMVTVKTGRREGAHDRRLSSTLERMATRFMGVVAVNPALIRDGSSFVVVPDTAADLRRNQSTRVVDKDLQRGEVAERPT